MALSLAASASSSALIRAASASAARRCRSSSSPHLGIVGEVDRTRVEALVAVDLLLGLEDLVDEGLVQLLVGVVDADLLQRVELHALEAEDVQHADLADRLVLVAGHGVIAALHNVREDRLKDRLADGVAARHGLDLVQDLIDHRAPHHDPLQHHLRLEGIRVHPEAVRHDLQIPPRAGRHLGGVVVVNSIWTM